MALLKYRLIAVLSIGIEVVLKSTSERLNSFPGRDAARPPYATMLQRMGYDFPPKPITLISIYKLVCCIFVCVLSQLSLSAEMVASELNRDAKKLGGELVVATPSKKKYVYVDVCMMWMCVYICVYTNVWMYVCM